MNLREVVVDALDTVRNRRPLWWFGFFIVAGGGSINVSADDGSPLPSWVPPLLLAAAVAMLVGFVGRVTSEAALIEGVRRAGRGDSMSVMEGLGIGRRCFARVFALNVAFVVVLAAIVTLVAAPAALAIFAGGPLPLGVALTLLAALPALPVLVTAYFAYTYGARFVVLDGRDVRSAIAAALAFLKGRVVDSMKLALADLIGTALIQAVALVALLPAALVGLAVYFVAGLVPGLVTAGVLLSPFAFAACGAAGTFRSALWTHAFLEEHPALG